MNPSQHTSLDPLPEEQWDPRLDSVLDRLGTVLNVHRVMARHPDLMEAWTPLRQHIATAGSLAPRHRELVILRIAHRFGVEYEWHHHVARGRVVGLSDEEIEAVRLGPGGEWSDDDATLLGAVDELLDSHSLSDASRTSLETEFSVEQILDLIVTIGMYVTLAMLINTAGIEIEDN
ncbi:MAG: carboxymuconolactone decarboxylase family protein [Acidimicrobiia bacterium]|nr:carboxymuconolactone decarboxylase family protein [Acidimicrobiia bacterium]